MVHWLCTCLSLEYFILSWFVLLTELKLFYNNYYKFLMGSSLGTVERFLFHARLLPMTYLFYYFFDLCHSSNQDFDGCSSVWYCVLPLEFFILSD